MEEIKSLDSREHILLRPNMYIGAVTAQKFTEFLDGKKQEIEYIPGLIKIINEIIDNSVDIAIKTNFEGCNEVSVKISEDSVEIIDNGPMFAGDTQCQVQILTTMKTANTSE